MKECRICHEPKKRKEFHNKGRICNACCNSRRLTLHRELRLEALRRYSGGDPVCACCGEIEVNFLTFDHTTPELKTESDDSPKKHGSRLVPWLLELIRPGFKVMCYNCNLARYHYGMCPHETVRRSAKNEDIDAAVEYAVQKYENERSLTMWNPFKKNTEPEIEPKPFRCAKCGKYDQFQPGPCGGDAQNFCCYFCGARYNDMGPFGIVRYDAEGTERMWFGKVGTYIPTPGVSYEDERKNKTTGV